MASLRGAGPVSPFDAVPPSRLATSDDLSASGGRPTQPASVFSNIAALPPLTFLNDVVGPADAAPPPLALPTAAESNGTSEFDSDAAVDDAADEDADADGARHHAASDCWYCS